MFCGGGNHAVRPRTRWLLTHFPTEISILLLGLVSLPPPQLVVCIDDEVIRVLDDVVVFFKGGVLVHRYSIFRGYPPRRGVLLDKELRWIPHFRRVEKGATQALNVLSSPGGSIWGPSLLNMRKIYRACIAPRMLYACSLWYSPGGGFGTVGLENAVLNTLTSLQRRAAQVIARAFRSTSGPALDVELHLLPVKHTLEKALGETLSRLRTSRVYYQIVEARRESRATEDNFRYWSPLRKLEERYDQRDVEINGLRLPFTLF